MKFDNETGILTVDEYDLHSIIVGLRYVTSNEHVLEKIRIVPINTDCFGGHLITKWEQKFAELIDLYCRMDADFHDDAEYTC